MLFSYPWSVFNAYENSIFLTFCSFMFLNTKMINYFWFYLPFISPTISISISIFISILFFHYFYPTALKFLTFEHFLFFRFFSLVKQQQKYFLQDALKKWKSYSSFLQNADNLQKEKGIMRETFLIISLRNKFFCLFFSLKNQNFLSFIEKTTFFFIVAMLVLTKNLRKMFLILYKIYCHDYQESFYCAFMWRIIYSH